MNPVVCLVTRSHVRWFHTELKIMFKLWTSSISSHCSCNYWCSFLNLVIGPLFDAIELTLTKKNFKRWPIWCNRINLNQEKLKNILILRIHAKFRKSIIHWFSIKCQIIDSDGRINSSKEYKSWIEELGGKSSVYFSKSNQRMMKL